ncbi:MAG: SprT family zinc-dependent metalloprotease [bacterium]
MTSRVDLLETVVGPARLKRSDRRTLAISVLSDGSLELTAPKGALPAAIQKKVEKRTRWIVKQRDAFRRMNAKRSEPRFCNGATQRYLGRQYRLKIIKAKESSVSLRGAYLHVSVLQRSENAVKNALDSWYRLKAREQFQKRLMSWEEWCRNRKLPMPKLQIKSMKKRWGSALKNGTIILNPELIHAPSACVDYVITHEICHLRYPDHGPRFIRLLTQLQPAWRGIKQRLEELS